MNLYKYILGAITFFYLLGSQVFAEELNLNINENTTEADIYAQVHEGRNPLDMYLSIYESTKNDIDIKTLERLSKQNNFTQDDLKSNLNGVFTDNLIKKCEEIFQSNTSQSLYQCIGILKDNYEYEKKLVAFETSLKGDAEASEIWSDGDLSNSFFDIIVDFNIIEIILFGENTYEYPFGDSYDFNLGNSGGDSGNGGGDDDSNDDDEDCDDEDDEDEDDEEDEDEDNSNICQDPDEIIFDKPIWQPSSGNNNCSNKKKDNSSQNDNPYLGGDFAFPESNDDCDGESLFQGLLCIDSWPCDNFFCIKISTIPQDVGGGESAEATSVQELITTGIKQLNYVKGHTLTVHKNSNERFIISVGKFFDRPISLDVITQGIPIKLTPKDTVFDKEPHILKKFQTELCKKLGYWCHENGDYVDDEESRTINVQTEEGELQQATYKKLQLNREQLEEKKKELQEDWIKAQKIKHKQSFWEEFRKNLNIMVLYFESIKGAFLTLETTGMDILNKTGNSCN